jgi:Protein of unknown function (DUF2867)
VGKIQEETPCISPASVVISTICTVHNLVGKIYLFVIVPFHRTGVRSLMRTPSLRSGYEFPDVSVAAV